MRTSFVFILRTSGIEIQDDSSIRASTISRFVGAYQRMFGIAAVAALTSIGGTPLSRSVPTEGAFYLLGIGISTNVDAFIPLAKNAFPMRFRPEGPRIPVPNWLIERSKSRDSFLSLAHDPGVFRPNSPSFGSDTEAVIAARLIHHGGTRRMADPDPAGE